jgi:transposase
MSATHTAHSSTANGPVLYLALELGWSTWKLAFTIGSAQKPRIRTITARDIEALVREIAAAKRRFKLPAETPLISCYEAGRDGFWLNRLLLSTGVQNIVVDASSIEVNRRSRRAKSDNLDATKLVGMLIRWHNGEKRIWGVVRVPSVDDEDRRQLHRELIELKSARTEIVNRIKGLLACLGLAITVDDHLPERLVNLRQWDDTEVPQAFYQRILRQFERWQLIARQIHDLETERTQQIRDQETPQVEQVQRLLELKGIGENGAWLLVREFFGWRQLRNRRELASLAGLTPTPYDSGSSRREQGISKAGNRRVRWMMVELAWGWLRYQPFSELSKWYQRRFGLGNSRIRKIGIVALARKLLIALWKYLEKGEVPLGAEVTTKKKFRVVTLRRQVAS